MPTFLPKAKEFIERLFRDRPDPFFFLRHRRDGSQTSYETEFGRDCVSDHMTNGHFPRHGTVGAFELKRVRKSLYPCCFVGGKSPLALRVNVSAPARTIES